MHCLTRSLVIGLLLAAGLSATPAPAHAGQRAAPGSPGALYTAALARERALRSPAAQGAARQDFRALIAEYDAIARRFPRSGYSDNALWQAAGLALESFERFGQEADRDAGLQFLRQLQARYPTSSLLAGVDVRREALRSAIPRSEWLAAHAPGRVRQITREALDRVVRITIELDRDVNVYEERLSDPDRLFVDLKGVVPIPELHDLEIGEDPVRRVRLGLRSDATTRVVLDLNGAPSCRVSTLSAPYRVAIDCDRTPPPLLASSEPSPPVAAPFPVVRRPTGPALPAAAPVQSIEPATAIPALQPEPFPVPVSARPATAEPAVRDVLHAMAELPVTAPLPAPPEPAAWLPDRVPAEADASAHPAAAAAPTPPDVNSSGSYSLARQLGLGVSRVVIDPGHGGHDPGARAHRLVEAEIVLDVALRLEQLLLREPGVEVILTRRTDVYVPLQERTALANRVGADLFLSIHANASRNVAAHGIETYFLNFASSPDAAAVAARENAASQQSMGRLPDLVKAIALTNKLDESRDFAAIVQESMVRNVRAINREVRNLGVKQAPFVVLIGAEMPSVLAEVSFLTNRREADLLRTSDYRQGLAESLHEAILRYRRSLRTMGPVAASED